MLKIHCPECDKSFLWTDDMLTEGKCPTVDCDWQYDIHTELRRNIDQRGTTVKQKSLHCPFCSEKISSRFTVCGNCGRIVMGTKAARKSYLFLAACITLILMSLIIKYLVI